MLTRDQFVPKSKKNLLISKIKSLGIDPTQILLEMKRLSVSRAQPHGYCQNGPIATRAIQGLQSR